MHGVKLAAMSFLLCLPAYGFARGGGGHGGGGHSAGHSAVHAPEAGGHGGQVVGARTTHTAEEAHVLALKAGVTQQEADNALRDHRPSWAVSGHAYNADTHCDRKHVENCPDGVLSVGRQETRP